MRTLSALLAALFTLVILSGYAVAGDEKRELTDDERAILDVIVANRDAAEEEDLEGYMATIHEDSPLYETTESTMEQIFDIYDLYYDIPRVEFVEVGEAEASVRVTQITGRISGPDFNDNETTAVHTLYMTDDGWMIYGSEIEEIEFLD